jgi:hypothetical protein
MDREVMTMMSNKALIIAGMSLWVAACASTPATPDAAKTPATAAAQLPPSGCVSQTATRIRTTPTECAGAGHVWTDDQIKGTGATDPAQALRLLDPTITVKGL